MKQRRRPRNERGATAVEYAVIVGLFCLGLIPAINALQDTAGTYLIDTGEDIGTGRSGPAVAYTPPASGLPTWVEHSPVAIGSNLVVNGGFESPVIRARGWRAVMASPWDSTERGLVEIWATGHSGVVSYAGNQHAELNLYGQTTYSQRVSVTPGSTYQWSIAHRSRRSTSESAEFLVDGKVVALLASGFSWTEYSGVHIASSSSALIEVRTISGSGLGNLIDDVSLRELTK